MHCVFVMSLVCLFLSLCTQLYLDRELSQLFLANGTTYFPTQTVKEYTTLFHFYLRPTECGCEKKNTSHSFNLIYSCCFCPWAGKQLSKEPGVSNFPPSWIRDCNTHPHKHKKVARNGAMNKFSVRPHAYRASRWPFFYHRHTVGAVFLHRTTLHAKWIKSCRSLGCAKPYRAFVHNYDGLPRFRLQMRCGSSRWKGTVNGTAAMAIMFAGR